jgi:HK97 gp10 family phage protein
MKIEITLEGTVELRQKFSRMNQLSVTVSSENVKRACQRIAAAAKGFAPVRTGELRKSIGYNMRANATRGYVGVRLASPAVRYWYLVEFGTVKSSAHPFFRPAAEGERANYTREMLDLGKKIVEA